MIIINLKKEAVKFENFQNKTKLLLVKILATKYNINYNFQKLKSKPNFSKLHKKLKKKIKARCLKLISPFLKLNNDKSFH